MEDVQKHPAPVAMAVDRVGVKDLRLPLVVRDRAEGSQHTVARVELSVDLPADFKGTHMSRFVEALENFSEELDYASFKKLLADICGRLEARTAFARFTFPYFLRQTSPVSGSRGLMGYTCHVRGEYRDGRLDFTLGVDVPVMTVCPCSKAISREGAHSQRAEVRVRARFKGFLWLEDLIEIAERSGSSPVYTLLKREDEKYVTETAFAQPTFVEDVVRTAAKGLSEHPRITWFRVEVESFESIHDHSAVAAIERTVEKS
ncbi:GTP cyclohydrolase FolE2 [Desulfovibrio aminophilus]|uniref:GTP cyclohydrolase FolE2 n=1 Tax=Desulfovibrio aminophilus TaxID=81425 RepID=UPI003390DEF5